MPGSFLAEVGSTSVESKAMASSDNGGMNKGKPTEDVKVSRQQQHTGNHERHEQTDEQPYGSDSFGGTRAGAENVEPAEGPERSST